MPTTDEASTKTILIVEDDEAIGELLKLSIAGETLYQPLVVRNGIQALSMIASLRPSLLVLDYRLPEMTGIELYDRLRTTAEGAAIPTIMTSAADIQQEIAGRNVAILNKPFDIDDLLRLISEQIS
jgi:DNA-binding response OmpR family regulator